MVLIEVMGTLTPAALAAASASSKLVRHLIIGRIDFHQHRPGLHVLVVIDIELGDVSGNPRADGIDVPVHLRVVGSFIAAHVAVHKKSDNEQDDNRQRHSDTKRGTLRATRMRAEVLLRRR